MFPMQTFVELIKAPQLSGESDHLDLLRVLLNLKKLFHGSSSKLYYYYYCSSGCTHFVL